MRCVLRILHNVVLNGAMLTSRRSEQAFCCDCYWQHSNVILPVHAEATSSCCTLAPRNCKKKNSHTKCLLLLFQFLTVNFTVFFFLVLFKCACDDGINDVPNKTCTHGSYTRHVLITSRLLAVFVALHKNESYSVFNI